MLNSLIHSLDNDGGGEFSFIPPPATPLMFPTTTTTTMREQAPASPIMSTNRKISNSSTMSEPDHSAYFHETCGAIRLTNTILAAHVKAQPPMLVTKTTMDDLPTVFFHYAQILMHLAESIMYSIKHLNPHDVGHPLLLQLNDTMKKTIQFCTLYASQIQNIPSSNKKLNAKLQHQCNVEFRVLAINLGSANQQLAKIVDMAMKKKSR